MHYLIQVMPCCLFDTEPLPEPIMTFTIGVVVPVPVPVLKVFLPNKNNLMALRRHENLRQNVLSDVQENPRLFMGYRLGYQLRFQEGWAPAHMITWEMIRAATYKPRADSSFVPSQWETALLCNHVSHWLGASLESALKPCHLSQVSDQAKWSNFKHCSTWMI